MKRTLLLAILCAAPAAVLADGTVPWTDAGTCLGRVCSVSGKVTQVEEQAGAIRLYFDDKREICVTLIRSWLVSWPNYEGRSIIANGMVRRFRDLTEISVHDPGEIAMADAEPTPAIGFESPEKQEVKELRQEIDRLEQRVKELESR